MTPVFATLAGVLVLAIGEAVRSLARMRMGGSGQVRTVLKVAQQVGLPVETAETGDRLADRLRRRARMTLAAIPVWVALGVVVAFAMPADLPPLLTFVPLWAAFAGQQIADSIAGVVEGFRLDPDRPRVASARLRTRADYADPFVRVGARLFVAVSALSAALVIAAGAPSGLAAGIAVFAAIAALVAADALAGSLARRRQHAANREELVWDDAFRALAINNLYNAPFVLAIYPLLASWQLFSAAPGLPGWVSFAAPIAGVAMGIAVGAYSIGLLVRRPAERMTRRLAAEAAAEASA